MTDPHAITTRSLSHSYGERRALQDVTFQVEAGSLFGLLGPNGGGKTTLFRILSTLMRPGGGEAQVLGFDVARQSAEIRRRIGVVFQSHTSDEKLTAEENLRYQGRLHGISGKQLSARIEVTLENMGLRGQRRDRVETLSGGQRRRLELGQGLFHQPQLLLLDEPTVGLDAGARRDFKHTLRELTAESGVTVVLTTHLMDEADLCDRLVILDHGQLVAEGSPAELKSTIGGDVLVMDSPDPEALQAAIRERFGGDPSIVEEKVRLERAEGHTFVATLIEAFPGQVRSITVAKPSLEDVFVQRTGHGFWENSAKDVTI